MHPLDCFRRGSFRRLALVVTLIIQGTGHAATITVQEIYEASQKRHAAIKSVSVNYVVSFNQLFELSSNEKAGRTIATNPYSIELTADRERRKMLRTPLTANGKPNDDPRARLNVFDGSASVTYISGRMLMIYPDKIKQTEEGDLYCSEVLDFPLRDQDRLDVDNSWYFPTCIKPDPRKRPKYEVLPDREAVDGASCYVVYAPGYDKLWIDPQLGFAYRKRERLYGPDAPHLLCRYHAWDFKDAGGGIQVPTKWSRESFPSPANPKELFDKPFLETSMVVSKVAINSVTDDDFKIKVPRGAQVLDHRSGQAYTIPGDMTDMMSELERSGLIMPRGGKEPASMERRWLLIGNLIFLAVIVSLFVWRWVRRKRAV